MYQSPTSLLPPLVPADYCSADAWVAERECVFRHSWHLVGLRQSLARPGQFLTCTLLDVPVIVRNFNGELVALRNVCAHRQAILATAERGSSPSLTCPYHGWEYGADGRTRRIPGAANFPKFDHKRYCLDKFEVQLCGDLVFVKLATGGPSLAEWMGNRFDLMRSWFSLPHFAPARTFQHDYESNWKIPVDISLESYHIPWVHAKTFHVDPGEELSEHEFYDNGSVFLTSFLAPRFIDRMVRRMEKVCLGVMGLAVEPGYEHHHFFPNLMISHTASLSLIQQVHPLSPGRSRMLGWQFGRQPPRPGMISAPTAWAWGKFTASLSAAILSEDIGMYQQVQAGAAGAGRPGLLGRCEERLFHYHKWVRERIDAGPPSKDSVANGSCASDGCPAAEGISAIHTNRPAR